MDELSTTNNTTPNIPIENTVPQKTATTKDACNNKTFQELIGLSSGNTSNKIMSNRSNNTDNVPAGNNFDE